MELDESTRKAILKRMEELDQDKEFKAKIEKEVRRLRGRNLKRYLTRAVKISEKEVRQ